MLEARQQTGVGSEENFQEVIFRKESTFISCIFFDQIAYAVYCLSSFLLCLHYPRLAEE